MMSALIVFLVSLFFANGLTAFLYRWPKNLPLGRSHKPMCSICHATIPFPRYLPLLNAIFFKNKCFCIKKLKVPIKYTVLELLQATMISIPFWIYDGDLGDDLLIVFCLSGLTSVAITMFWQLGYWPKSMLLSIFFVSTIFHFAWLHSSQELLLIKIILYYMAAVSGRNRSNLTDMDLMAMILCLISRSPYLISAIIIARIIMNYLLTLKIFNKIIVNIGYGLLRKFLGYGLILQIYLIMVCNLL